MPYPVRIFVRSKGIAMIKHNIHRVTLMLIGILSMLFIKADGQVLNSQNDLYSVLVNTCSNYLDVKANDHADSFPSLQLQLLTQPAHGRATVNGNYLSYCPDTRYLGADHFKYLISDSTQADSATVYINVVGTNSLIFPGDADQNGKVENYDILAIGLAYHLLGPSRIDSISYTSLAWGPSAYLNSNPGAADCNGDGIVDSTDYFFVENTYHDTLAGFSYRPVETSECKGDGIPFYIQSLTGDTVVDGDTMEVVIKLGNDTMVNEAYGIAFTLEFDNGFIPGAGITFNTTSSWMLQNDAGLFFKRAFQPNGKVELALTKTNHAGAIGGGEIMRLRIPIDDNIDGIITAPGTHLLNFKLSNVRLVSPYDIVRDVCVEQPNFMVNKVSAGIGSSVGELLRIYPNPSNGNLIIEGENINKLEITDLMGRNVYVSSTAANNQMFINLQPLSLPDGAYFVKIFTKQSSYVKQIFLYH